MKGISQTRMLLYCIILGFLPLFFVSLDYFNKKSQQDRLDIALSSAIVDAKNKSAKGFLNKQVKARYRDSNHFYIDKEIETITPLENEIEILQKVLSRGYHPEEEHFKRRLQFLTNGQNSISFVEGSVKSYPDFQETHESFAHPVEVDLGNLKAILARVEGIPLDKLEISPQRPHLIVTDFKMEKRKGQAQELYLIDLKVIKREYIK